MSSLNPGDAVLVQKYLDANVDGVLDGGDILWQQFQLTDGQAGMVFSNGTTAVTNFNVPGDLDGSANGAISARLYPHLDFAQEIIGKYLYVLSSPAGHFSPITNAFSVTNFPFAQSFGGDVVSNATGVALPDTVVLLFNPFVSSGPAGGTVANSSGHYSIKMPPGAYQLLAVKSNFVMDATASPLLNLDADTTIVTNLTLTNATQSISGKLVDASNSLVGLPGVLLAFQTQKSGNNGAMKGWLAVAFTDTNGAFTARVTPNQWRVGGNDSTLATKGYLSTQGKITVDTATGGVSDVTIALPKATAVIYGTVKDNLGNPLPGVTAIYVSDNNGNFQTDGYTDPNGNYVAGAVGGLSGGQWQVEEDYSTLTNYVFSRADYGIALSAGQAFPYNFTAILATNHITGHVQYNGGPVSGVQVYADATLNALSYQTQADTDTNGNYSLNVANGTWNVNVYDCGCSDNDSLNNVITGGYVDPGSQNVGITNNNGVANFTVLTNNGSGQIFGCIRDAGNNPITNLTVYIGDGTGHIYTTNTDSSGYYSFLVASGGWGVTLDCGQLNSPGYQCVGTNFVNVSANSVEEDFTVQPNVSQPLQINTASLPDATENTNYSTTLTATGGTPPYNWSLTPGSASLPEGLTVATNGVISGTPVSSGTNGFITRVTDATMASAYQYLTLTVLPSSIPPVIVLASPERYNNGEFQFILSTASGTNYTIQFSTDLKTWTSLLTFQGSGGPTTIIDPNAAGASRGFYRIKLGP